MERIPARLASHWMEATPDSADHGHPALEADTRADAVVIGGGIAGLCTAWELARAGQDVILVEAGRLAGGVSGHTTAKVSALHGLIYRRLRSAHDERAAELYAASQQDAVAQVGRISAELGIDCELEQVPAYSYAYEEDALDAVREEAEAAEQAGLDASFVTATGLPFPVAGAVRVEGQAQFHPRIFLRGLAADLVARGGRIFERSRVVDLREGDPCRITTAHGKSIQAREVVVATHYPVFDRTLLFPRLIPRRELVVAASIPAERDPQGIYLTSENHTRSVRTAPYGEGRRLLIVTGEKFTPGARGVQRRYERLTTWMRQHFPDAEPAYRWAAQDLWTTDQVPFVGPVHSTSRHLYVATGFGGWGMTGGVLAGRLLAAHVSQADLDDLPWADLYDPRRLNLLREGPALLGQQADVARHFIADRLPWTHCSQVADIPKGGGALVRLDGTTRAVHRDTHGTLHSLSARCTHLGCLVHFNDAEQTWECPCHGSRFAPTNGTVLQGPAVHPLTPHQPPNDEKNPPGDDDPH